MIKLAAALLLVVPSLALAQDPNSISGKWKVTTSIGGNENSATCSFTQTGKDLTGTCAGDQGTMKITGKVDGSSVSWSYASDYNGTALTLTYKGKLADGKITGEATVDPFGVSGEFSAAPAK